ncbi:SDR family oxidoreductase [Nitrosomonas nitrosa]|uniref:SDR family oxidoreductase n=1 Tax=Nitrosomonas nitrosa TaxID=52442 RepID=UPI0023F73415|nr:NAD-dependent epimerase/dehydratase family protein [Nitrosomonas nitrosa]MCO6433641.1 NAD-dependent epimerase/dehydratase family protein [Nitrosomonas nitrosa]
MSKNTHIVTGAFGYSGKYLAKRLLEKGRRIKTLTNSINRSNSFGQKIEAHPFNFENSDKLIKTLEGASVLYNTYWVRFNYKAPDFKHSIAVKNTLTLFDAAKKAGIERIVHVSITNPSLDSPLEYFKGKAILEKALIESGISYAVLRPTVLFGTEDILINNIAWLLRKLPVFGVFGDGNYKLQPIYVDDLAELAVREGENSRNVIIDAIGPETFTYRELIGTIGQAIGKQRPVISVPDGLGYSIGFLIGKILNDIPITREEIAGLKSGLLCTNSLPAGHTRFTDWAREHAATLGIRYTSELARRRNKIESYARL